ncbi:MAG: acyltransferase [Geminicoccaceae bacterium]|nr:acyltransferase [Geminicoccaceae bacterium]
MSSNVDSCRFDAHPWEFAAHAGPDERARQEAYRAHLGTSGRVVVGTGGYLSPHAYILGQSITLGSNCVVAAGVRLDGTIAAGDNCSFNLHSTVAGKVTLGHDVRVATGASLWGFDHAHDDPGRPIICQGIVSRGIEIGDDVWIGANAVVTDGVRIGSHVIVAAGAVVTRNIPDYAVAAGNPARIIRDRRARRSAGTDKGTASLQSLSDLADRDWRVVLSRHRTEDRPGFRYSDPRNDEDDPVRPDCDAIQIAAMFGEVAEGREREGWRDTLQARQDPGSGLFLRNMEGPLPDAGDGQPDNCHLYDILCVTYALECLGGAPLHRMSWADRILESLPVWLDDLPWHGRGWHSGAMIDSLGTASYVNTRYFQGQPGLPSLIGELSIRCHPSSGMWSPPTGDDWLQPVNGYYRLTRGTFAQFGLPVCWPDRAIDTVLAHAVRNDFFDSTGRTACNILDIVHPLLLCSRQTDHRAADIDIAFARMAASLANQWQPQAGFAFGGDEPAGLQGTEMWLSIAALISHRFKCTSSLSFSLAGIHRLEPAMSLTTDP